MYYFSRFLDISSTYLHFSCLSFVALNSLILNTDLLSYLNFFFFPFKQNPPNYLNLHQYKNLDYSLTSGQFMAHIAR